jgi:hypothetical protein
MIHVPYKGGAPAMQALIAGEVQMTAVSVNTSLPHIRSGRARARGQRDPGPARGAGEAGRPRPGGGRRRQPGLHRAAAARRREVDRGGQTQRRGRRLTRDGRPRCPRGRTGRSGRRLDKLGYRSAAGSRDTGPGTAERGWRPRCRPPACAPGTAGLRASGVLGACTRNPFRRAALRDVQAPSERPAAHRGSKAELGLTQCSRRRVLPFVPRVMRPIGRLRDFRHSATERIVALHQKAL